MKVCHSLKNRSRDVRDVARETLVKMAVSQVPAVCDQGDEELPPEATR